MTDMGSYNINFKKVENGSEKFIDGDGNTDYSWLLTE